MRQGATENPSAFYESLCEAAKRWTDLNPDEKANQRVFNMLFIGQLAQDTRKKLQKVDGARGMSTSVGGWLRWHAGSVAVLMRGREHSGVGLQVSLLATAMAGNAIGCRGRGTI